MVLVPATFPTVIVPQVSTAGIATDRYKYTLYIPSAFLNLRQSVSISRYTSAMDFNEREL